MAGAWSAASGLLAKWSWHQLSECMNAQFMPSISSKQPSLEDQELSHQILRFTRELNTSVPTFVFHLAQATVASVVFIIFQWRIGVPMVVLIGLLSYTLIRSRMCGEKGFLWSNSYLAAAMICDHAHARWIYIRAAHANDMVYEKYKGTLKTSISYTPRTTKNLAFSGGVYCVTCGAVVVVVYLCGTFVSRHMFGMTTGDCLVFTFALNTCIYSVSRISSLYKSVKDTHRVAQMTSTLDHHHDMQTIRLQRVSKTLGDRSSSFLYDMLRLTFKLASDTRTTVLLSLSAISMTTNGILIACFSTILASMLKLIAILSGARLAQFDQHTLVFWNEMFGMIALLVVLTFMAGSVATSYASERWLYILRLRVFKQFVNYGPVCCGSEDAPVPQIIGRRLFYLCSEWMRLIFTTIQLNSCVIGSVVVAVGYDWKLTLIMAICVGFIVLAHVLQRVYILQWPACAMTLFLPFVTHSIIVFYASYLMEMEEYRVKDVFVVYIATVIGWMSLMHLVHYLSEFKFEEMAQTASIVAGCLSFGPVTDNSSTTKNERRDLTKVSVKEGRLHMSLAPSFSGTISVSPNARKLNNLDGAWTVHFEPRAIQQILATLRVNTHKTPSVNQIKFDARPRSTVIVLCTEQTLPALTQSLSTGSEAISIQCADEFGEKIFPERELLSFISSVAYLCDGQLMDSLATRPPTRPNHRLSAAISLAQLNEICLHRKVDNELISPKQSEQCACMSTKSITDDEILFRVSVAQALISDSPIVVVDDVWHQEDFMDTFECASVNACQHDKHDVSSSFFGRPCTIVVKDNHSYASEDATMDIVPNDFMVANALVRLEHLLQTFSDQTLVLLMTDRLIMYSLMQSGLFEKYERHDSLRFIDSTDGND